MLHMHSLSQLDRGCNSPTLSRSSSLFLALSLTYKIICQQPLWATLAALLTINRELHYSALTLPHSRSASLSLHCSPALSLTLSVTLQFTFQAAWPQNQFSNNSSHDFIQLGNFQCGSRVAVRSPLRPPLSTLHLWLCVVVFIPLRVIQAYYVALLLFAARRQIFAWNMRRGRTSQRMSGWWGWEGEGAATGSVRRLNVWQAPDLYFPIVERQL